MKEKIARAVLVRRINRALPEGEVVKKGNDGWLHASKREGVVLKRKLDLEKFARSLGVLESFEILA
jgi:hypothetical protein